LEKEHQPRTSVDALLQVPALPNGYNRPAKVQLVFYSAGRPKDCAVIASSGSAAADQAVCEYAVRTLKSSEPKSRSADVPAAAVRYLNATFVTDVGGSRMK
jgi:hypothetical protein